MKGCGRGRVGLEVAVEHIAQVVVKFCRGPRSVLSVAKVVLFQWRIGWALVEKSLDPAVNICHENIFISRYCVYRHPNRELLALSGVQICAKMFERAESGNAKTGDIRDIQGAPLLERVAGALGLRRRATVESEGRFGYFPLLDNVRNALLNFLWSPPYGQSLQKWENTQMPLYTNHRDQLGLQGGISRVPVLFASVAHFPSLSRRERQMKEVSEMMEVTSRLDEGQRGPSRRTQEVASKSLSCLGDVRNRLMWCNWA